MTADHRLELARAMGEDTPDNGQVTPESTEQSSDQRQQTVDNGTSRTEEQSTTDPLAGLTVQDLLKHPDLSRQLKSWSDTEAAAQLRGRTDAIRREEAAKAERQVEERLVDTFFTNMPQEQVAEEISRDPDLAVKYSQYQARQQARANGRQDPTTETPTNPDDQAAATKLEAYALQIRSTINRMEELPDEVKVSLAPEKHLPGQGEEGLLAWTKKVDDELLNHRVNGRTQQQRQAEEEERAAQDDQGRPRNTNIPARRTDPLPDVVESDPNYLMSDAIRRLSESQRR